MGNENILQVRDNEVDLDGAAQAALRMDSKRAKAHRKKHNARKFDAVAPGQGFHLAGELEYQYEEALEEEFPPQTALEAFPVDNTVPAGARTHTATRISKQGEPRVYRGNARDVPTVGASKEEEKFPVRHYVIGIEIDLFEQQSSSFANSGLMQKFQSAAGETMNQFLNRKSWFGDDENGIYGVLNYPWIPKMVLGVPLSINSALKAILDELNDAANYAHEETETVYSPNSMATSPRVLRFLRNTYMTDGSGDSLMDRLQDGNPRLQSFLDAPELKGAGPNGTDAIVFYRRTRMSIANVIPQTFTMLPAQKNGFSTLIPCYMSHGGMVSRNALNQTIAYVQI